MILGINKRQWVLILIAVGNFVVVTMIGMWQRYAAFRKYLIPPEKCDELAETMPEIIRPGWREAFRCECPWSKEVIPETVAIALLLGALGWLVVYVSRKDISYRLPTIIRFIAKLIIAIFIGVVYAVVCIDFAFSWVFDFWCGPLLGLLQPTFVIYWSPRLVFPVTSILIFWVMWISEQGESKLRSLHLTPVVGDPATPEAEGRVIECFASCQAACWAQDAGSQWAVFA